MRLFSWLVSLGVFISAPCAAQLLTSEAPPGTLPAGAVAYLDDGTCGADKVKRVIGGRPAKGIRRQVTCLDRPEKTAEVDIGTSTGAPLSRKNIHFIHMGGNDCPPCRAWRALELPKLQASPLFKTITYSYVTKAIGSPVPPEAFLPPEVRPLKAKLDTASSGRNGSPHQVLVLDGEVYDYWFGERNAEEILASVQAIATGARYPFSRCIKRSGTKSGTCEIRG